MNSIQISELIHLLHSFAPDTVLAEMASDTDMYTAPGPTFETGSYGSQAEVALIGLSHSAIVERPNSPGFNAALLQVLRALVNSKSIRFDLGFSISILSLLERLGKPPLPQDAPTRLEFASLARRLAEPLVETRDPDPEREQAINALNSWANLLERASGKRAKQQTRPKSKPKSKATASQTKKKRTGGGKQL